MNNSEGESAPVLPISTKNWQRLVKTGYGLLRMQNSVVGMFQLVEPIYFDRGATDAEIAEAWEHGQTDR